MREKSLQAYQSLCEVIPGGVNSPVRAFKDVGQVPLVVERAYEDTLVDVDGKHYLDFCGSWGALIHGHAHPKIIQAIQKRASLGTSFGTTTKLEEKLARKVISLLPSLEKIRFVSSGTEATMSALRLARGYTQRDFVIKFSGNYHGHADPFLVQAGSGVADFCASSSQGVPKGAIQNTLSLPFNDPQSVVKAFEKYGKKIAAVIVEPIAGNMGVVPGTLHFLETLRRQTEAYEAVLIFDEVMTGFRVHPQGAQGVYGINPDLTCLGKIVGGGLPAAAFGGKAKFMDALAPLGRVYQAGTLSGNPLAMEAGYQALLLLEEENFYQNLEEITQSFVDVLKAWIKKNQLCACVQRAGSMFTLFMGRESVKNMEEAKLLDQKAYVRLFSALFEEGIYFPPSQYEACFVSSAHKKETAKKLTHALEGVFSLL